MCVWDLERRRTTGYWLTKAESGAPLVCVTFVVIGGTGRLLRDRLGEDSTIPREGNTNGSGRFRILGVGVGGRGNGWKRGDGEMKLVGNCIDGDERSMGMEGKGVSN